MDFGDDQIKALKVHVMPLLEKKILRNWKHNVKRVSEEGVSISDYNTNDDIKKWCNEKKALSEQSRLSDGFSNMQQI